MHARTLVFAGCLNKAVPHFATANGTGIAIFHFDETAGLLSLLSETSDIANPTYLASLAHRRLLFATSEVFGVTEGRVTGYRLDVQTGTLVRVNSQPTRGSLSAYCNTDARGLCLFVANYAHECLGEIPGRHVASFSISDNGALSPAISEFSHKGSGPRSDRQSVPHGHCVVPSPDNRYAIVTDLGTDELITYALDASRGRLAGPHGIALRMAAGAGPRHFVFHPNGSVAYVINELDTTICQLAYAPRTGTLSLLDTTPGLPEAAADGGPADLHISADGRFLYGSFRGASLIATYSLDDAGKITTVDARKTGGKSPRSFALSPSGRFMLVANQDSDLLECFRIHPESGRPEEQTCSVRIGTPMCVKVTRFD